MSIFEKVEVNVFEKSILLGHRAKYQKKHSNVVSIIFFILYKNDLETFF